MERLSVGVKGMLTLAIALHLQHHFHGPTVDYVGLAAAAAASWAGVPGPGEPVLIAEAVFAARHDLDIGSVIVVAWAGACAGGVIGWLAGLKGGRAVITARGPLHSARIKAVHRGEEVFARHPVLAIYLTPSWVAGIHRPPTSTYLIVTAISSALWAAGIGLGAYFAGPPVLDFVSDLGLVTGVTLVVIVVVMAGGELVRRRRRAGRGQAVEPAPGPELEP
jgi:membrane protein DedA with SNARE-associated domain